MTGSAPAEPARPPTAEPSIEDRLLAAALETATIHGLARLAMGDVAKRAGLSRQTLYRYFPSRDALVTALVAAETDTLIEQVAVAALVHDDPRASLEAAMATALRVLRDHPLLDRLIHTEPESLLPLLTTEGSPAMTQVRSVVELVLADRTPDLDDDPVARRRFADVVTRLLISYAISAPDDPPEVVAHYLSNFLVPDTAEAGHERGAVPGTTEVTAARETSS